VKNQGHQASRLVTIWSLNIRSFLVKRQIVSYCFWNAFMVVSFIAEGYDIFHLMIQLQTFIGQRKGFEVL
jgi:hypothetical protein